MSAVRQRGIARSLQLLQMLTARPHTLTELSAATGKCRRTIYRDLDTLQRAGFPVTVADDQVGRNEQLWLVLPCRVTRRILAAVQPYEQAEA